MKKNCFLVNYESVIIQNQTVILKLKSKKHKPCQIIQARKN